MSQEPSKEVDNNPQFVTQTSVIPLGIDGRVGFHQQTSPPMLQLKVKTVGVKLEVICSSFDEEAIFDVVFEDDSVKIPRLSVLTGGDHFSFRD